MLSEVKLLLDNIKKRWDTVKNSKTGWLSDSLNTFKVAIPFLISSVDELMKLVATFSVPGADKKTLVMNAVGDVYDYVVGPILPFWMIPFKGKIRELVLVMVSSFVDFLVGRLRENKPV